MTLSVKLKKNSAFNDETHFFYCLIDLINEWEETIGAKKMDKDECGIDYARLLELRAMIPKEVKIIGD